MEKLNIGQNAQNLNGLKVLKKISSFGIFKNDQISIYQKEYLNTKVAIQTLDENISSISAIEENLISGIYKMELLKVTKEKINQLVDYDYNVLLELYINKISELRRQYTIISKSKKEILTNVKQIQIDYLSRLFVGLDFSKIELIRIAKFSNKDLKKLYSQTINNIEKKVISSNPVRKMVLKDNLIGKFQLHFGKFLCKYYEILTTEQKNELDNIKKSSNKKSFKSITYFLKFRCSFLDYFKKIFLNKKNRVKYIEDGISKEQVEITSIKYILEKVLEVEDFYGAFCEGFIEDKVNIYKMDQNLQNTFRNSYLTSGMLISEDDINEK